MFFPTILFVFQIHVVWEVEHKCKKLEKIMAVLFKMKSIYFNIFI